ncbi:MAG: hypothetical protein GX639_10055 [Fibrobacter sp.]|jgi:hypothetical protein|nr:hypothetical protein [Fibrobacter sp.]
MAKVKKEQTLKQDDNIYFRINSTVKKDFISRCKEKNREYSEVVRSLIGMVISDLIEIEEG